MAELQPVHDDWNQNSQGDLLLKHYSAIAMLVGRVKVEDCESQQSFPIEGIFRVHSQGQHKRGPVP